MVIRNKGNKGAPNHVFSLTLHREIDDADKCVRKQAEKGPRCKNKMNRERATPEGNDHTCFTVQNGRAASIDVGSTHTHPNNQHRETYAIMNREK
jgi:hypothetical protein